MASNVKNIVISTAVAGLLVGCGGGGSSSPSGSGAGGLPTKGPFIEGTEVVAVHLDTNGDEIDADKATTTIGSDYKFSFNSSDLTWSGPTKFIIKDGQYYNEATGGYSVGTLMAIEELNASSDLNVNINILTDIAAKTILAKMATNPTSDITSYKDEAKTAVVETFNISLPSGSDLEDLDLTSSSGTSEEQAANTQLLKLTTAILSTDNPEEVVDNLVQDLGDGNVDGQALASLQEVQTEVQAVDLVDVASKMETALNLENVPNSDDLLAGTLVIGHGISFPAKTDVSQNTPQTTSIKLERKTEKNEIENVIYGSSTAITISNGEYRVNGGAWGNISGTVSNGDILEVRHTSSTSYSSTVKTEVTIGGTVIDFMSTTEPDPFVPDTTANSFDLGYKKGIAPNTSDVESDAIIVSGVNTDTPINILGGEYAVSTDNGSTWSMWSSAAGTVQNTNQVKVRVDSSTNFSSSTDATLTIGGSSDTFKVFTTVEDKTPKLISFTDQSDVEVSTVIESGTKTLVEFNTNVDISITDGEYSINGGAYTSAAGTVSVNDTIKVRHTSSADFSTDRVSKLTIGSSIYDFKSSTKADPSANDDTTPNAIMFSLFDNQELSAEITSAARTVTGINAEATVSITNGSYSISTDNGATWSEFTSNDGVINLDNQIRVKQTTSDEFQTKTETVLTVGGVSNKLVSYTKIEDAVSDVFTFTSQSDVAQKSSIISNTVTIAGINVSVPVSIDNGTLIIDGAPAGTSGNITNGQTLAISHTSATQGGADTYSKVTVGSSTATFKSTTAYSAPQISGTPATAAVTGSTYSFAPTIDGGDNITSWTISGNPSWMKINNVTGEVYGTPVSTSEQVTTSDIVIIANNPGVTSGTTSNKITFNVTVGNFVPVLSIGNAEVTASIHNGVSITPTLEDKGGDTKLFELSSSAPSFLSIDSQTGVVTNNRDLTLSDVANDLTFDIIVTDGSSATDSLTITLDVIEWDLVNQVPPTISGTPDTTVAEDSEYLFKLTASDVNSANLTFSIENKPTWATFDTTTGVLTGTPVNADVGTTSDIVISVTENGDKVDLPAFSIEVTNTNDAPTATDIPTQTAAEDSSTTIDLSSYFNDIDVGDVLTYDVTFANIDPLPTWMDFDPNTAILTVNATNDHVGSHQMKITAKDKAEESVVKEFTLTITNVNDKPVVEDIAVNVVKNTNKSITLSATDIDNDTAEISFSIATAPDSAKGTATISGNTITFTPATDVIGEVTFTYKANDGTDDSDTKTVTVTVLDVANVKDVIPTLVNWDEKGHFDLGKMLTAGTYADLTALDPSTITSIDTYEFENEQEHGSSGEKRVLWVGKNDFVSTTDGFDWDKYELDDGSFVSDLDPVLGIEKLTLDENEIVLHDSFKNFRVKYIGEIDASEFNDSTHNIFGSTSKAYAVAVKVVEDSYGFDEKVRDWSDHQNEVYHTSISGFITAHSNDSSTFKGNDNNPHRGLAFASGSTGTSGTLVEIDHMDGITNSNAGTWEIVTIDNRNILKIIPTIDGYHADEDLTVFTEESGFLYRGWMDKAGNEFGTYFLDESAKDELIAYYDMIGNNIKKSELVGKKIRVSQSNETYYFRENDVLVGDTGMDYSTVATYEELSDGTIKIMFLNGEYDIIKKTDFEFTVVYYEYDQQGTLVAQTPENVSAPEDYNTSDSDYQSALTDNRPDTNLVVVDPYIKDAKLCFDANSNNQCDVNEPVSTMSNENGIAIFSPGLEDGSNVIMVNPGIHNGQEFNGRLKAKVAADLNGKSIVSPLTTMLANGFDSQTLINILVNAGITNISTIDLNIDPMGDFANGGAPLNYDRMQSTIAIHTFLAMTDYGLTPDMMLDSMNNLKPPYDTLFPAIVNAIKSAVNPNVVASFPLDQQQYITPQVIINVGVAISNYLVKKYIGGDTNILSTADYNTMISALGYAYGQPTNSGKHFMLDDNANVVEVGAGFNSFGIDWKIYKPSTDERYNVTENVAKKDDNSDTIILNSGSELGTDARSEVRKYFDSPKAIVKAKVRLKEANSKSRGQVQAIMENINSLGDKLYASATFGLSGAYAWIGKYDSNGNNEQVLLDSVEIGDVNPVSEDGSIKHTVKIEVVNDTVVFTVQKVDGTKTSEDDGYILETYAPVSKKLDGLYDLGIDRLQFRSRTDLRSSTAVPTEKTQFRVHYASVHAGNGLSQATKDAIAELEAVNLETQDIDIALTSAKTKLDDEITANGTADAKLAKTLIRIAEIANSDEVSDVLSISSPTGVSDLNYLNQIVRSTALDTIEFDLKDNSGSSSFIYSDSQRELFHKFATELKQISEDMKELFTDEKTYGYDGEAVTYKESIMIRSAILAAAFKLEYLSAYRMGSDDDLRVRTETIHNIEFDYMNINIDPASAMNSGNVFKLQDGSRVDSARSYAIEALTLALNLPVGYEDITADDKTEAQNILDSLSNTSTSAVFELEGDDEIKSIAINLSTLYSSAGALRLSDFGTGWTNVCSNGYTYHLEQSKMRDDLICMNSQNWTEYGDIEASTLPTSATSRIDDIITNITKLDNSVLTGQDVIDFLFEEDEETSNTNSVIAGKSLVIVDSVATEEVRVSFSSEGTYFEHGERGTTDPLDVWTCTGRWSVLTNGKIGVTCDNQPTEPTGILNGDNEIHITLPSVLTTGQSLTVEEENNSSSLTIGVIADVTPVSGKQISASDSEGNMIAKFYSNGNYEESGNDNTDGPFSCSGKWIELLDGKVAVTCEDTGTSRLATGTLSGDSELHYNLPTQLTVGSALTVEEENDSWTLTIGSISNL